jgi:hypothetical protein
VSCRVCGGERLDQFLDLGETPLANAFSSAPFPADERRYRLAVSFCRDCGHVQLVETLPPDRLFSDYLYVSGTSESLRHHFEGLAADLIERQQPWRPGDFVVEIASNDGTLQSAFAARELRCIGVEPAANVAALAREAGHEVLVDFFNLETARRMRQRHGPARVITGSNVLGHVDELRDFVAGLSHLLADDGLLCMEVPHLLELLRHCEFDTIYHEHVSYMALRVLRRLFADAGLTLFEVTPVSVHGGSIRVFARHRATGVQPSSKLVALLAEEEAEGLGSAATFHAFAKRVASVKRELISLLTELRERGARIAGYGAAAKGNTLLNYCGIGRDYLDFVVDRSPLKQGLYSPGASLPVCPVERLREDRPDYLLLLAWNFAEEIMAQQADYARAGGRFIIPLPTPTVIDGGQQIGLPR